MLSFMFFIIQVILNRKTFTFLLPNFVQSTAKCKNFGTDNIGMFLMKSNPHRLPTYSIRFETKQKSLDLSRRWRVVAYFSWSTQQPVYVSGFLAAQNTDRQTLYERIFYYFVHTHTPLKKINKALAVVHYESALSAISIFDAKLASFPFRRENIPDYSLQQCIKRGFSRTSPPAVLLAFIRYPHRSL